MNFCHNQAINPASELGILSFLEAEMGSDNLSDRILQVKNQLFLLPSPFGNTLAIAFWTSLSEILRVIASVSVFFVFWSLIGCGKQNKK